MFVKGAPDAKSQQHTTKRISSAYFLGRILTQKGKLIQFNLIKLTNQH